MNKSQLVANMAEKSDMSKVACEKALNAFMESVEDALKDNDKVVLVGFGTFEVRKRAARKGRNPRSGEAIQIAASQVPVFKAGTGLKTAVK